MLDVMVVGLGNVRGINKVKMKCVNFVVIYLLYIENCNKYIKENFKMCKIL